MLCERQPKYAMHTSQRSQKVLLGYYRRRWRTVPTINVLPSPVALSMNACNYLQYCEFPKIAIQPKQNRVHFALIYGLVHEQEYDKTRSSLRRIFLAVK